MGFPRQINTPFTDPKFAMAMTIWKPRSNLFRTKVQGSELLRESGTRPIDSAESSQ